MDKEDRLRLQHIHLTLLAIQHALSGSRHPDMKAWDQWMRAEGAIAQGSVNIPLTEASPEFHYSLPAEKDLRSLGHEGLEVWPESHWPGFALRQADVLQSYTA